MDRLFPWATLSSWKDDVGATPLTGAVILSLQIHSFISGWDTVLSSPCGSLAVFSQNVYFYHLWLGRARLFQTQESLNLGIPSSPFHLCLQTSHFLSDLTLLNSDSSQHRLFSPSPAAPSGR